MKHTKLFLFLLAVLVTGALSAFGQDGPPPDDAQRPADRPDARRPNLLAALGLSPEQVQQIRRMNQGRRMETMRSQHRMREAAEGLDMAIYADTFSESDYKARLTEFQAAQAEVARLRFESELSLRKVLTPEQLVKFRGIREEFAQDRRDKRQDRHDRRDGAGRPDRRGFAPRQGPPPNKPIN